LFDINSGDNGVLYLFLSRDNMNKAKGSEIEIIDIPAAAVGKF
jgi:hypothetical protein